MMIVVSVASPIINLAAVSRLSLLQELFGSILVPPSVWAEVMAGDQFALPDWLELRSPADQPLVASLCAELDRGEAEARGLASQEGPNRVHDAMPADSTRELTEIVA